MDAGSLCICKVFKVCDWRGMFGACRFRLISAQVEAEKRPTLRPNEGQVGAITAFHDVTAGRLKIKTTATAKLLDEDAEVLCILRIRG
jgi:hypothetical protein